MKADKKRVVAFFNLKGIDAHPISRKTSGKVPDLELWVSDSLFGYCEIKSIIDYEFMGERNDPTYNKIQNKIHEAAKQFAAYNHTHKTPNLLLFMNHYRRINFGDLWHVLMGQPMPPNQPTGSIDVRYAKRLAEKNDLEYIDYFIWIDVKKNLVSYTVNDVSPFKRSLKEKISSIPFEHLDIKSS